jgi:hypothetical protein
MELEDDDDPTLLADELGVSLHALTGLASTNTMQQLLVIAGTTLRALVDSGSTHTFIHEAVVHRLGLTVTLRPGLAVKVANGERIQSYGVCKNTTVNIQREIFVTYCYTLPLEGFDVILVVQWLKSLGMIVWDFAALSMAFVREGRSVRLLGDDSLCPMVCATRLQDNLFPSLLQAYANIFAEPRSLPPPPRHDHRIHLLPGTPPVAVRPYRYPQLLKDEVERQCQDMLSQGIIHPSTSPFSAPVLFVKKSDSTWGFCVDYHTLNDKTVKDKFPIPIVDELLDELRGAQFFTKIDLLLDYSIRGSLALPYHLYFMIGLAEEVPSSMVSETRSWVHFSPATNFCLPRVIIPT